MGYGVGGIMRSFLVYPTYIVFPNLLPTVQLFDALHRGQKIMLQKKRIKFFWLVFIGIFFWEWLPEYIAPYAFLFASHHRFLSLCRTLTGLSIFCLAAQKSPWVTRIFGKSHRYSD